jgi:hypothetical protein
MRLCRPRAYRRGVIARRSQGLVVGFALLLLAAAPAAGEEFKPGSLRLTPNTTHSASKLVVNAGFDQEPGAQLKAYNVDIARGFRFDPHAVEKRCSVQQAQASTCPAASRIGSGSAKVTIAGKRSTFGVDFYLTPPQRHGDIAGLVLSVHQAGTANGFALIGRMVRLAHGPYGLELRFADAGKQLPAGLDVQLNRIHAKIGAHHGRHSLLATPRTCTKAGWPFRLFVAYSTGTETYSGPAACSQR